jgi:WhiB family redox-sensing transcriptional regulator
MTARALAWIPDAPGAFLADGDPDLSWQDAALCAQSDAEAWFPEKGGSVALPKAICGRCPVRTECLEFALETEQRFGIWGGLSTEQRLPLLAARGHHTDGRFASTADTDQAARAA